MQMLVLPSSSVEKATQELRDKVSHFFCSLCRSTINCGASFTEMQADSTANDYKACFLLKWKNFFIVEI